MPMPILASVCWEAGFVWLCGGWVCGIPRVVAWWCCGVLRVVAWSRACGCVPACLRVCGCGCVWGGPRACVRGPPLVVCCGGFLLSRTPWGAVPLARPGLASRFGMLLGVSPVL